ncbi:hypothetical protein [Deinococcus sp. AJ005]|uniref:hypothetical protein n=1 Tax=Deinococcus sp. AJ005 TaxID=2652443 RepID=UPI0018657E08|nr:hypothetical protein [Deinococcus sp. AJ005]
MGELGFGQAIQVGHAPVEFGMQSGLTRLVGYAVCRAAFARSSNSGAVRISRAAA